MTARTVKFVDPDRNVLAVAHVADEGDHYGGTIDLRETPAALHALFDEFEEVVNGQMFSFLDQIQEKMTRLSLRAVFDSGVEVDVKDLQVFPSTGDVSFKVVEGPGTGRP